ncbi:MAG: glycosyltransferase family 9 protein [bacterium]
MKILVIRFSSIGDIVLTTPIVRCLKEQLPNVEIHYLTKKQYIPVLQANPYITKIQLYKENFRELVPKLKAERFDRIIDLHKNIRSHYIRFCLRKPATSFPKVNFQKWLMTRWKIDLLPPIHLVDRYFKAVEPLGIRNDGNGLDYFLPDPGQFSVYERFPDLTGRFIAIAIGARHATKIYPAAKVSELCDLLPLPAILLGGKEDMARGEEIIRITRAKVFNACGLLTLNESVSVIFQAVQVISNDTGMMHIAAALKKPVISLWGNTIPGFGMYPYFPEECSHLSTLVEVKSLSCRPCSKLGYPECPKKHFDCMEKIDPKAVVEAVRLVNSEQ